MKLTTLDAAIFVVYILAVAVIGLLASRRAGTTKRDYFLAGDKLPWWMVGGSIVASNISSHQFVAMMGTAFSLGFITVVNEWGAIILGLNALLWLFLPFYLRKGFYTMPEFLERRYGPAARSAYGALILLVYVFVEISAVLYLGALALYSLLGIPMVTSIMVLAVLTAIYTITGGLKAVVWTEMVQLGVLLLGGITLSIYTINAVGGWSAVAESSKTWNLLPPANDPNFPWTMLLGGGLCVSVFYWATNQFIVQRGLAARSEWDARAGVVMAQYLKFLLPLITVLPGMLAPRLFHLEKADLVFPTLVERLLPPGLVGLVMAGLIAAIMSHVSGALNSCSTIACLDFYIPYIRKNATEQQAVRFGKMVGIVIAILGMFWATVLIKHSERPVFLYLMDAYGYFAPGIAAMFLLGILWKRTTYAAALTMGALTVPLSVAIGFLIVPALPPGIREYVASFWNRSGIVFWICILAGVVVSLLTRPKTDKELEGLVWTRESLHLPKEERIGHSGLRNPAFWWLILTVIVVGFYVKYH